MAIDKTRFMAAFKAETRDRLARLNEGILAMEKDPGNAQILQDLMKDAHTVKGSATMMGLGAIAEIAHKMEDGFTTARGRAVSLASKDYDLLFECLDLIESTIRWRSIYRS